MPRDGRSRSRSRGPPARRRTARNAVGEVVVPLAGVGTEREDVLGLAVAGVCTGGMLLARAGVLDGRPAVTHGDALDELRESEATVVDARVVDDGDVLTAGGVTAGLDLAVHLVEREWGSAIAADVLGEMEYEPRGAVYRP